MYRKALAMGDSATADKIINAATPTEAQKLGRQVQNYDSEKWKNIVDEVAETCNWLKFSQVDECKQALLDTGDKFLAESNPADRNWGIGFRGDEAAANEDKWGRNLLGKAQMKVRDRLNADGASGRL